MNDSSDLVFDWNADSAAFDWSSARVDLNDEILRDGLQSPSVRDPSIEQKLRLLHLIADLGIASGSRGRGLVARVKA